MNVLFLHQNMPGQFGALALALAKDPKNKIAFITKRSDRSLPGVTRAVYKLSRPIDPNVHHYMRMFEEAVLHGQAAARACLALARADFKPDIIVGHPGWGEALFVKDVFPSTPLVVYAEHYERGNDDALAKDRERILDRRAQSRCSMAHLLLSLEASDRAWSPLEWQKRTFPSGFQEKIDVLYDGVPTHLAKPDENGEFELEDGRVLRAGDEVITYVARGLEPCRGFDKLMTALPMILKVRPNAVVVIVGDDECYYGYAPPEGSWRLKLSLALELSTDRVIFTGRLAYRRYLNLLKVSSLHLYLSEPFVLSWSFMEALSSACLILAADTDPVREVLIDGENGVLAKSLKAEDLARSVDAALGRADSKMIRVRARETVIQRYSADLCLPKHIAALRDLAA